VLVEMFISREPALLSIGEDATMRASLNTYPRHPEARPACSMDCVFHPAGEIRDRERVHFRLLFRLARRLMSHLVPNSRVPEQPRASNLLEEWIEEQSARAGQEGESR
jgi:hypothetical protein